MGTSIEAWTLKNIYGFILEIEKTITLIFRADILYVELSFYNIPKLKDLWFPIVEC